MGNVSNTQFEKERRFERKPFAKTISCSVTTPYSKERKLMSLTAHATDISKAGIGLQTDYALEPGDVLWFDDVLEEKAGFVKWCLKMDSGFRVGVELDGTQVTHLDEATHIFNKRLEVLEKLCLDPHHDPSEMLSQLSVAFDDILSACQSFEDNVHDTSMIRDTRRRFYQHTDRMLSKSHCIQRIRTWPQGYQGDYKTLESIYRNTPLSDGIGYYLDSLALNWPLASGVRNRLSKLKEILKEELSTRQKPSVLNIACGSCREVFELSTDIENSGARFTCIDIDDDALAFAANRLSFTNISPVSSDQVILRKYNAVRMFDHELNMNEFGRQDIIYSVGFFDYLESEFLIRLINSLYNLLNPGGLLILSFKDAKKYRHQEYHWIADWDGFLQRNENDFKRIISDAFIPDSAIKEIREESGIIVFYLAGK
jgi:SAM-dependent methyltransferase